MINIEKVEEGLRICTSAEPCNDCPYLTERDCNLAMAHDAMMLLKKVLMKKQPEIVRCGDCKWRNTKACFCKAPNDVQDDWFCSEGEKRK